MQHMKSEMELVKPVIVVHHSPIRVTVEDYNDMPTWNGRTGIALGPSVREGCTRVKFDNQHFVFSIKNEYLNVHNGKLPWATPTQEELQSMREHLNNSIKESGLEDLFSRIRERGTAIQLSTIDEVAERFY